MTPAGGGVVFAVVHHSNLDADPTLSGLGLVWTKVASLNFFFNFVHISLYKGIGTPTPGTVTITYAATPSSCGWQFIEAVGATDVVQSATQTGSVTYPTVAHKFPPATVALAAFAEPTNGVIAAVTGYGSSAFTKGAGYTQFATTGAAGAFGVCSAEWYGSADVAPGWAAQSGLYDGYADGWGGLAAEIAYPTATAPTATTEAATSVTDTTATLNGTVNANLAEATVSYEISLNSDMSGATTVAATPGAAGAEAGVVASTGAATGLTPGTLYYHRVKAVNSVGTSYGATESFTTALVAPLVTAIASNLAGTRVEITFDKAMADPTGKHAQFTYSLDGVAGTFSAAALDPDSTSVIVLTVVGQIVGADHDPPLALTVSYTAGTVLAADGGVLATFSGTAATNGSVGGPLMGGTADGDTYIRGTADGDTSVSGIVNGATVIGGTVDSGGAEMIYVTAVDSAGEDIVVVSGSPALADNKITKNGATYNLTGKTVTAKIRAKDAPNTAIDASLETIAVTNGGGTYTEAQGGVTFQITSAMLVLLQPPSGKALDVLKRYFIQYNVTTDDFQPAEVIEFAVRRGL